MRGAGDAIEAFTKATGIKAAVEAVAKATGTDCGCSERRDRLNKLIPFKREDDELHTDPDGTEQRGGDDRHDHPRE